MNTLYNRPDNSASVHHQHQPHMHSSTPNHHSHSQAQQRSQSFSNLRPHMSRLPLDGRVRGDDGRFMSRTDIINPIYHQQHRHNPTYHRATASSSTAAAASPTLTSNSPAAAVMPGALKVCGWCGRTSTSQWRVGPTNGSLGTL